MSEASDGTDEREPPHWWEPLLGPEPASAGQSPEPAAGAEPGVQCEAETKLDAGPPNDT